MSKYFEAVNKTTGSEELVDGYLSNSIESVTAASIISKLQCVYSGASGVAPAIANSDATAKVTGLSLDAYAAAAPAEIVTSGRLTGTVAEWSAITEAGGALVDGEDYYLSTTTAGGLMTNAEMIASIVPATERRVLIGRAITTTSLMISIGEIESIDQDPAEILP